MLPKSSRLSKKEVEYVLKTGKRSSSKYFLATVAKLPSNNEERGGFAVVVSKKTAQSAVDRNKLRRRVYSAIRAVRKNNAKLSQAGGGILKDKPTGVVIVVKREAKSVDFSILVDDMAYLIKHFV